jgi:REP element-mobilizing transposase RayT
VFTYFHLAADRDLTDGLLATGSTCVAYETLADDNGRLPLLTRDRTRRWVIDAMLRVRETQDVAIWAYVIMPEHVHLLVWPRRGQAVSDLVFGQSSALAANHVTQAILVQLFDPSRAFLLGDVRTQFAHSRFALGDLAVQAAHFGFGARGIALGAVEADRQHDDQHARPDLQPAL